MSKVLLIDDSKTIQRVAKLILQGSAYSLLTSESSKHAQELADSERPDIALVDLSIGTEDGLELIKVFRENPLMKDMKVVLLYSHLKKTQNEVLLNLGIDAKLEKPFDAPALLGVLNDLTHGTGDKSHLFDEKGVDQYLDHFLEKKVDSLGHFGEVPSGHFKLQTLPPLDKSAISQEAVERVCREIIPPLAERIIREELKKLLNEKE